MHDDQAGLLHDILIGMDASVTFSPAAAQDEGQRRTNDERQQKPSKDVADRAGRADLAR